MFQLSGFFLGFLVRGFGDFGAFFAFKGSLLLLRLFRGVGIFEGFMLFLRALLVLRFVLGGLKTLKFFGLYCKRPDFSEGFFSIFPGLGLGFRGLGV